MISLFLLLLSAALSFVLINIIPFGLEKRQKKVISVSVPVIGSLGLAFSSIAPPWQSILVMVLLAAMVGYALISRTTENLETEGTLLRGMDTGYLSKIDIQGGLSTSVDQDENNVSPLIETNANVVSSNQEEKRMDKEISFLEVRNNPEFDLSEIEVIPVLNFEGSKDEVIDHIAYDAQPS